MAAAANFNGGRSQCGLNVLQTGGEYAFLNVVKTCQDWAYSSGTNTNGPILPSTLDPDGYPNAGIDYYSTTYVPASWVGQSLTVQWDGGGEIRVPGSSPVGTVTSSNGSVNNSITCTCISQQIYPGVVSSSASPNHIKNIRVSLTGSETTKLNAGEVFSTAFKNKLIEAGFGVLRFMDWQYNNTTNVTDWASRTPVSYFSYQASLFRPNLFLGDTGGSANAYTISGNGTGVPSSGGPTNGQTIHLHFHANATQSGGATLSLNGTTAKSILNWWGSALSPDGDGNSYPRFGFVALPAIPYYGTLIFDSILDAWLLYGANTAQNAFGIKGGVPPELCLQLAAEIGAHAYFVLPRFAVDYATDYAPSLSAYCRDNAPTWMIPRFEGPNETFNTANGEFHNGPFAINKASARWASADQNKTYGYWMSILGQAVATAYGVAQANTKTQQRYQVLCGIQTTYGNIDTSFFDQHMSSAAYIGQAAAAPAGYSKAVGVAEAWRWTTHVCCAQYFATSLYGTAEETALVTYWTNGDAAAKDKALTIYNDGLNGSGALFTLTPLAQIYSGWKNWAKLWNVTKMCGYEGGYSTDYSTGLGTDLTLFRNAAKASSNLPAYLAANYSSFVNLSDSTFVAEFPSQFLLTDFTAINATTYVWTLLKGDIESPNTPAFDFIVRFNKGRRAISPRLRIHG